MLALYGKRTGILEVGNVKQKIFCKQLCKKLQTQLPTAMLYLVVKFVDELSVVGYLKLGYSITDVPAPGMYDCQFLMSAGALLLVKIADRNPIVVDCTETTGN